ncbi:hypothetical protein, partial [Amycolatopsis sp. cmx-4-54]|uniref:hypothetical protein n=1 Tax=Amycolatopsis sp. cmx-4-54 TaxID=2790936 RepID=UPI00397D8F51
MDDTRVCVDGTRDQMDDTAHGPGQHRVVRLITCVVHLITRVAFLITRDTAQSREIRVSVTGVPGGRHEKKAQVGRTLGFSTDLGLLFNVSPAV